MTRMTTTATRHEGTRVTTAADEGRSDAWLPIANGPWIGSCPSIGFASRTRCVRICTPSSSVRSWTPDMHDVIVIGGGHNGLIAAAFLAKAGLKTLVLERMDRVGGCAQDRRSRAGIPLSDAGACGGDRSGHRSRPRPGATRTPHHPSRSARLRTDGGWPRARAVGRCARGRSTRFEPSRPRTPSTIRNSSPASPPSPACCAASCATPPPSLDDPKAADLIELLKTGRAFRALGKADAYRLLRWMPMAVADLAGEWFESEPLRATVAAGGIARIVSRPVVGGHRRHPAPARRRRRTSRSRRGWFAAGGPGALADALAAAARSRRRRDSHRRRGRADRRDGRAPRRASRSPAASRFPRGPSSRTPIRSARCSGSSIRSTSRRISSAACRTSGRMARSRR